MIRNLALKLMPAHALTLAISSAFFCALLALPAHADDINMLFTSNFPSDQRDIIEKDLLDLAIMEVNATSPDVLRAFSPSTVKNPGSPASSASTPGTAPAPKSFIGPDFEQWLADRVKILVPADYQYSISNFDFLNTSYKFPLEGQYPKDNRYASAIAPAGRALAAPVDAMSNIGAVAYSDSKLANKGLRGLKFPGIGEVALSSPRIGLVQVQNGFFKNGFISGDTHALDNVIFRLGILFHEGRHSDGNGKTQGFFHVVCPKGHAYAGLMACDSSRNGAYTIGALFVKTYAESCKACSRAQKEKLRTIYVDSFDRVLKSMPLNRTNPPEVVEKMHEQCKSMRDKGISPPTVCLTNDVEYEGLQKHRPPVRDTLEWDDAPEGSVSNSNARS